MNYLITYLCIIFSLIVRSQNYVPNGSFENYTTCPRSAAFYDIISWCGLSGGEEGFNVCNNSTGNLLGIPYNQFDGFQYPKTGHGMGCVLLHVPGAGQENRREYLHAALLNSLQAGKIYCGTFYANLSNEFIYTTDKIGLGVTTNSFACNQAMPMPQTIAPLNITPQVANTPGNFITDTLNWVEVSGTFTANGTEAYLTIGNFYDDANTPILLFNSSATRTVIYLFIDDVSIEEVFPAKAKNDTAIVVNDSIAIGNNPSEAAMYTWQPTAGLSCTNCPNPKASPNVTTTYTVTKTQCKSITTDIITVNVGTTGIEDLSYLNEVVGVSPNPTNGIIIVTSKYDFEKIELLSIAGQVLLSETVNEKAHQLQLQNFAEGIYFARVVYPNGMSTVKKIIVSR